MKAGVVINVVVKLTTSQEETCDRAVRQISFVCVADGTGFHQFHDTVANHLRMDAQVLVIL